MQDNRSRTESAIFFASVAERQLKHLAHRVELETKTADDADAILALGIQFSLLQARDVVQRGVAAAVTSRPLAPLQRPPDTVTAREAGT